MSEPVFDVFLCHHSVNKSAIKRIANQLHERGVKPWLDEWELRPGISWQPALEEQIEKIKSAAVFVGSDGIGPWQNMEIRAFLSEFVNRNCPVIPVILPGVRKKIPSLPLFLRNMTWVDFRKQDPDPLERLVWGITGISPTVKSYESQMLITITGEIAAGGLVEPCSGFVETVAVNLPFGSNYYGRRVTGDSMTGDGIRSNDVVILSPVVEADKVKDGTIVEVEIDGNQRLLKHVYYLDSNRVILRSSNPSYPDIEIDACEREVQVKGKIVKILQR